MAYNVSYTTLPTFTSNSIGYSENLSGTVTVPNNTNVISVCNFNLGIGVYIMTVNISGLYLQESSFFWAGGLSNSATTLGTVYATPPQWGYSSNRFVSSINFSTVIPQNTAGKLYVNIQIFGSGQMPDPLLDSPPNYICSIVRIA